jgi:hypothetical protein
VSLRYERAAVQEPRRTPRGGAPPIVRRFPARTKSGTPSERTRSAPSPPGGGPSLPQRMRSDAGLRHDGVAAAAEGRHEAAAELLSVALGLMPGPALATLEERIDTTWRSAVRRNWWPSSSLGFVGVQ